MPNEVDIIIKDTDKTGPAIDGVRAKYRHLKQDVDKVGDSQDATAKKTGRFSSALGNAGSKMEAGKESLGKLAVGATAAGAAFVAVNETLNAGIAIRLAEANAQTALGDSFGMLEQAAKTQAHQLGLTSSEFMTAAGQTANLAKNMGFAQDTAAQFGMMMPDLANRISLMSGGQRDAAESADMMRAAMAGEFDPLQTVGINISANIVAQKALNIQQQNGKKFTDQQANALAVLSIVQEQTADTTKTLATEAGKAAQKAQENSAEMRQAWQDLESAAVPVLSKVTQSLADELGGLRDAADGTKDWKERLEGLTGAMSQFITFGLPVEKTVKGWLGLGKEVKDTGDEAKRTSPKVSDLAKSSQGAAKSAEALAKATEEATKKIQEHADVVLGARDADRGFEQAIDDARDALKENGKTLDINTQAGRDNQEALDNIAKAAYDQADAVRKAGGSEAAFKAKLDQSRGALINAAVHFGLSKKAAERYADSVLGIPKAANTKVNMNATGAFRTMETVRVKMANLDGTTAWVYVKASESRGVADIIHGRGEHAHGGVVGASAGRYATAASGGARGGATLVNERGGELFNLPPGTRVSSHPDSMRMLSEAAAHSGGGPAHVVLDVRSDDPALLALLRRMVRAYGGTGTDSVQVAFGGRGV